MHDSPPALLHGKLCGTIIDSFYTVYNVLKPGFLEGAYREALQVELGLRGVACTAEAPLTVYYKGHVVGRYRADLIVEGVVIVECKVVDRLGPAHRAQVINYLHATNVEVGLLLNFGPRPAMERLIVTRDR